MKLACLYVAVTSYDIHRNEADSLLLPSMSSECLKRDEQNIAINRKHRTFFSAACVRRTIRHTWHPDRGHPYHFAPLTFSDLVSTLVSKNPENKAYLYSYIIKITQHMLPPKFYSGSKSAIKAHVCIAMPYFTTINQTSRSCKAKPGKTLVD